MALCAALVLVAPLTVGSARQNARAEQGPGACESTPRERVLSVVGPMSGSDPVWFVDGSVPWPGADDPVKTLWVFVQSNQRIEITGRLRNGSETARFLRGSGAAGASLVIADPGRESVRPGGATAEVLRHYAFIPSLVFYPVAGCWEFTVVVGGESHRLVRNVEARP